MRPLTVVHSLGWYFPEASGGTEVYVDGLARALAAHGIRSEILAASASGAPATYDWNGSVVHRFPVPDAARADVVERRAHARFDEFAGWLESREADIYHQHSWTRGCGLPHLRWAKAIGLPTVLTVHVPSPVCVRGTMMLRGQEACDGVIDVARCTECWGTLRGVPADLAAWQARNPDLSNRMGAMVPDSRLRTALRTPALVAGHRAELLAAAQEADRVVAVCGWLYDALAANGIPPAKLACCRQGAPIAPARRASARQAGPFRIGFLGRWDPAKGIHVIVDAVRRLPPAHDLELVVHALPGVDAYEQDVRRAAAGDPRIVFAGPVPRDGIAAALHGIDALAVPSICLETGPMVVLEAFAAGVPVIGSNLGGIAELVQEGQNGWLVPHADADAWPRALVRAMAEAPALHVASPRTVADVAAETSALYRELCEPAPAAVERCGSWS